MSQLLSPVCLGFRSLSFGFSFRGGLCVLPASVYPSYDIYEIQMEKKKNCTLWLKKPIINCLTNNPK